METTAIPAVKDALAESLEGAAGLEGVVVARKQEPARAKEYVWIRRGKSKRDFALLGPRPAPLDEIVEVTIRVVAIGGEDPEARTYEIFNALEAALRADPDLSDDVLFQKIGEVEDDHLLFDQKPGFHVVSTVTAKARI